MKVRNWGASPERGFLVDQQQLEVGDVILSSGYKLHSKAIQIGTQSQYSHAGIWVGGTMIEAVMDGVYSKNLQRVLSKDREHLAVLRSVNPLTMQQKEVIENFARDKVGSLYSFREAISVVRNERKRPEPSASEFCSRLVARAYESAGIILEGVVDYNYCSPADLERSSSFKKLEEVIIKASPEQIEFASTEDPTKPQADAAFQWLRAVRKLAKNKNMEVQTINHIFKFVFDYPEFDEEVCLLADKSGYFLYYDDDRKRNPYRYDNELFNEKLESFIDGEGVLFFLNEWNIIVAKEYKIRREQAVEAVVGYEAASRNNSANKSNIFFKNVQLCLSMLKELRVRVQTYIGGLVEHGGCQFIDTSFRLKIDLDMLIQQLEHRVNGVLR